MSLKCFTGVVLTLVVLGIGLVGGELGGGNVSTSDGHRDTRGGVSVLSGGESVEKVP